MNRAVVHTTWAGCLLLTWATAAGAADGTVYRCGPTYQQVPCTGGQAVDADDARSASQRRDARSAAAAERRQASELAAERHAREKLAPAQRQPMGLGLKPAEPPASAPASGKAKPSKKKHHKPRPEDESPRYLAPPAAKN
ncbi:hypothetical protein [Ideonella sp.]|uniref:hypothetical protein n=1 Tax=Ideonella sp. TaxID=1929293 RepID=UPI002B493F2B|nr:hypothetical protein [Ideonella sp.]HJV69576.1 hypothetical protein [Ideonella sp.]